jgi:membrane associated rhomboid family serine protease
MVFQEIIQAAPAASFIFLITLVTSIAAWGQAGVMDRFLFVPYLVWHRRELGRFIGSGLIHADIWHLAFNLLTFFSFAPLVEQLLGHFGFVALYAAGLIVSDLPTLFQHKDDRDYASLGASGAISAVIFAFILYFPTAGISLFFIPMPAWVFAILYLAFSAYGARRSLGGINHSAHLYGALVGLVGPLVFDPAARVQLFGLFS